MRLVCAILLALLACTCPGGATDPVDGRDIYQGRVGFAAGAAATTNRLPVDLAACARCHGPRGEGGGEGGVVAPPLRPAALRAPRDGMAGFSGPQALRAAIADGIGREGQTLGAVMPRYRLSVGEMSALLTYMDRLGSTTDLPPGVGPDWVRFGAVLPLSGPAITVGRSIRAGLESVIGTANARGGVHARRVLLVVEDSAGRGAAAAVAALLDVPEEQRIFAVVAGLWGNLEQDADQRLASARVAHIASLAQRRLPEDTGPWAADLLAPLVVQRESLVRALRACAFPPAPTMIPVRWALGTHPDAADQDGAGGIRWFANIAALRAAFSDTGAPQRGCLGYGLGAVGGVAASVGAQEWERRVILPFPTAIATPDAGGGLPDIWRRLGQAAGAVALEALARAGPGLHEAALLAQIADLQGFAPLPGAPLHFARHRRYGWDASIITIPPATGRPDDPEGG